MEAITAAILSAGASVTVNSLWVLAWLGGFDKLKATRRMMRELYAIDIDTERDTIVYVGDSENDAPMFAHFPNSVFGMQPLGNDNECSSWDCQNDCESLN